MSQLGRLLPVPGGQTNDPFRHSAGILAQRRKGLKCADSGHSPDRRKTAVFDPEPTFVSSPTDRWVYRGAVIRTTRISSSRQLFEQRPRLFEIGGIEALGEPAVDRSEQIARLGPPALFAT
jgi:hypothetical protein